MAYNKKITITLSTDTAKAIAGLDSVAKRTDKIGHQFTDIGRGLNSVFDPAFNVLMTGVTAASAAMAGLGIAALSVGGSFEKQMSLVQGVAGATNDELARMKAKAEELGATLPISASEAASAMYNLASSGMSVNDILLSINDIVAISIAQNHDLESSSALVVSTQKEFHLTAKDTGQIVDVYSNAISNSMLNMTKLGESMKTVGPLAYALGMSLEETVAAMEVLADLGLEGSMIGTSLRRVLSGLADQTGEAGLILEQLGVRVREANGDMRDFSDIMQDLKDAGMSAEQALKLFGDRGAVAAIALADAADSLGKLEEELKRYGKTQEQVNLQQATFENKVKSLRSAVEAGLIEIFDQIHERAGDYADDLTEITRATGEWLDATDAIDQVLDGFFEGLGLGLPDVESFKETLNSLDPAEIAEKFEEFGRGIRSVFDAFKTLVDAIPWQQLIDNLDTITKIIVGGWVAGKITIIGDAILLLSGALTSLAGSAATVDATIMGSTVLKGLFGLGGGTAALAALSTAGITAVVYELMNPTKLDATAESMELIEKALNGDREAFKQLNPEMQKWLETTGQVKGFLEGQNEELKVTSEEVADLAERMRVMTQYFDSFMISPDGIVTQLKGNFSAEIIDVYSKLGQAGLDALMEKFQTLPEETRELMLETVNQVQTSLKTTDESTKTTGEKADKLTVSLGQSMVDFANYVTQAKRNAVRAVREFGVDADEAGETFKTAVVDKAEATANNLVNVFQDPQMRTNFINSLKSLGKSAGNELYSAVADALDKTNKLTGDSRVISDTLKNYGLRGSVKDWEVEVVKDSQTQTLYKVTSGTQELFHTIMKGQQDVGNYDWTKALDIEGMKNSLNSGLSGMSDLAATQGDTIGKQLETGIKTHIDSAVAYAKAKLKEVNVSGSSSSGDGKSLSKVGRSEI